MQTLQGEQDNSLELTGALDIIAAEEVRTSLLAHLEHHGRLSLDLSRIESCDMRLQRFVRLSASPARSF
jgi:hypothetical protein